MKLYLSFFAVLISSKIFSCDCDVSHPVLEFYESEYVFEGIVSSKIYSKDSLMFTINYENVMPQIVSILILRAGGGGGGGRPNTDRSFNHLCPYGPKWAHRWGPFELLYENIVQV